MKKFYYIISLIIIAGIFAVNSCSKDDDDNQLSKSKNSENQLSPRDQKINNLIKQFKKDIEYLYKNPDVKNGDSKPVDSAVWYLESTLNYSHSFPAEFYTDFEIDTVTLVLNKNANGNINMTEIAQKYYELKGKVSAVYHDSQFEDKGLNGIIANTVSNQNDKVELEVVAFTGEKGDDTPPPDPIVDGPFEEGDNWWYGENAGKCDSIGLKASDAANELWIEMQATINEQNTGYWFVNPVIVELQGGDPAIQIDSILDNHLDFRLFFASELIGPCGEDTLCIEWTEMNIYYQHLKYVLNHSMYEIFPALDGLDVDEIIFMEGYSTLYGSGGNQYVEYQHKLKAKYGEKINDSTIEPTEID